MGYDRKYGKVTTEHGDIGDDEPVVVFRARDITLPNLLCFYAYLCMKAGSPTRHLAIVSNSRKAIVDWQRNTGKVRVPSSESSRDRLSE